MRGGAGFVVGDRLETVSPAEKGTLQLGDAWLVFRASREFAAQPAMDFRHALALRGNDCLRSMKPGEIDVGGADPVEMGERVELQRGVP
jgi:hypothetical protein